MISGDQYQYRTSTSEILDKGYLEIDGEIIVRTILGSAEASREDFRRGGNGIFGGGLAGMAGVVIWLDCGKVHTCHYRNVSRLQSPSRDVFVRTANPIAALHPPATLKFTIVLRSSSKTTRGPEISFPANCQLPSITSQKLN